MTTTVIKAGPVQACITNVSFPQEFDGLRQMLAKNTWLGTDLTDIDVLLQLKPGQTHAWTAPRWFEPGDILFFYHAASAPARIKRLRNMAQQAGAEDLIAALDGAGEHARRFAGTIFACARVTDRPAYERLGDDERHFDSRVFAPFDRVHRFARPLPASSFSRFVKIMRQGTLTSLDGEAFYGVVELLAHKDELPPFVSDARIGRGPLRDVEKANWRARLASGEVRFIHENQLRSYLIDYLLTEVKDSGAPLHVECECIRGRERTGYADYMLSLGGRWVPVEAKLNVLAERDLPAQVARYTKVDAFVPFPASSHQRISVPPADGCVVIDQAGLSVVSRGQFVGGGEHPMLTRAELCRTPATELRGKLLSWLS